MKYYRKQPVEAMQWTGDNQKDVSEFIHKVAKNYCTKDDGYGNLNVCYMDSKRRKHFCSIPKFGWVVVEGKTLQFYKDETFRKTFKAAVKDEEESAGIDWEAMDKSIEDFFETFDKDKLFRGFHGVPKEKIQDYVNKKASEDPKDNDKSELSILDLARQADKVSYKRLMEIIGKYFEDNYQSMLDKWLETLPSDANKLQKYAANEKDVESDTFDSVLDEMKELHAKKNACYGDAAHVNFLKYGPVASLSRLSEKMQRAEHILLSGKCEVKDEPLTETLIDIAITSAMLYMELKNKK